MRKKFLGKGKYFDHKDIQALASACQIDDQPVFIDIGANVGLYSFLLNKAVPGLRALALEPHPGIYKKLRYNIRLNPDMQIESLQYAVSDQSGLVKLKTDYSNLGMTKISTEGEIDVECTTLMDLINTERVSHVDAIKVDVGGFEDRVLVPYLKEATEDRLARVIVLEFVNQHRWKENLFEYTRLRGFREVQRTRMNSILAR